VEVFRIQRTRPGKQALKQQDKIVGTKQVDNGEKEGKKKPFSNTNFVYRKNDY